MGFGFNHTSDRNYDMVNKKLANVAEGTVSSNTITKNQLDTAVGNKHGNDQNIDLKGTYNVINSEQHTFNEMNANRNTLVCYEDVKDVFVSRKESVFPMQTHLDMGTNYIYNVRTPISNDQGVNKSYADTKLSLHFNHIDKNKSKEEIQEIKELYKYYHYEFWCYQKAYKYFKKLNLAINMFSTGLIVIGAVAGGLTANPAILESISGAGLALKIFSETKDYKPKIETSRFAYSTYQKILLDLRPRFTRGAI